MPISGEGFFSFQIINNNRQINKSAKISIKTRTSKADYKSSNNKLQAIEKEITSKIIKITLGNTTTSAVIYKKGPSNTHPPTMNMPPEICIFLDLVKRYPGRKKALKPLLEGGRDFTIVVLPQRRPYMW